MRTDPPIARLHENEGVNSSTQNWGTTYGRWTQKFGHQHVVDAIKWAAEPEE